MTLATRAGKRENDHNVVKTRGSSLKKRQLCKKYVNIQTVVLNKQYNRSNNVKSVINPSFTKAASVLHACLKRTDASYGSAWDFGWTSPFKMGEAVSSEGSGEISMLIGGSGKLSNA